MNSKPTVWRLYSHTSHCQRSQCTAQEMAVKLSAEHHRLHQESRSVGMSPSFLCNLEKRLRSLKLDSLPVVCSSTATVELHVMSDSGPSLPLQLHYAKESTSCANASAQH